MNPNRKFKKDVIQGNKENYNRIRVKFLPERKEFEFPSGIFIIHAAEEAGITIESPCGGHKKCGKCRIKIEKGEFPPTNFEKKLLSEKELHQGIRLACCSKITTDSEIYISDLSRLYPKKVLNYLTTREKFKFSPPVFRITDRKLDNDKVYGIAFDLGTTNIVASLVNLAAGKEISRVQIKNSQINYGADVVSRLEHIKNQEKNLHKLHNCLILQINELIDYFLAEQNISVDKIIHIVCIGNTFIQYTLTDTYPKELFDVPFSTSFKKTINKYARELNIHLNPDSIITIIPGIGSFVGSDISSVILSSRIYEMEDINIAIDLGTNGEIVISKDGNLLTTSCSCGPAFEGGNISTGMSANPGAIESFRWDKDNYFYSVIGGVAPQGICGTGLVDIIAYLRDKEKIRVNGKLEDSPFHITDEISITQEDIRQFQLAKAAIRTGIDLLLARENIKIKDVNKVLLAGNFGNFANPCNLVKSNLLPKEFFNKIRFIGNAALSGAEIVLCSEDAFKKIEEVAHITHFVNLASTVDFQEKFVEYINFD